LTRGNLKSRISGILVTGIILILFILLISGAVSSCSVPLDRFEETREKMGTYVNIVVYAGTDNAREIIDKGFDEIDRQSKISSNYDPESSVSELNQEGFIIDAPAELIEIVRLSIEYNKISSGAFDISVDPVLKLWSEGLWQESEEVQQQKMDEALKLVDSTMISIDGQNIKFEKDGMSVTLGGVAKGYIVDKVLGSLKTAGIKNALVNAGGDIATLGAKPDGSKWIVSLENPDDPDEKIATFGVKGEAVTTSGNYYRYFDPEGEFHHIIDPRTGYSANECISVTIITENATIADILSTSVFVLGPEDGMMLVEELNDVEALIIDSRRNIAMSSGIDKYLIE
jgi:thiamine biosynthesis lipoprotein